MKPALRALLIAGEGMKLNVLSDKKLITIREGHRDFVAGQPVLLGCHILDWATMRTIDTVKHTTLGAVTLSEMNDDGYKDYNEMEVSLREFYPNINCNSPVTVVRWKPKS